MLRKRDFFLITRGYVTFDKIVERTGNITFPFSVHPPLASSRLEEYLRGHTPKKEFFLFVLHRNSIQSTSCSMGAIALCTISDQAKKSSLSGTMVLYIAHLRFHVKSISEKNKKGNPFSLYFPLICISN